jgi:hypothetical protein
MLLACVLVGLVIMGHQLTQVQQATDSRDATMAQQIEMLGLELAKAETHSAAAEDRDRAMEQKISALSQRHTGQLDSIEATLVSCRSKTAEH